MLKDKIESIVLFLDSVPCDDIMLKNIPATDESREILASEGFTKDSSSGYYEWYRREIKGCSINIYLK